MKRKRYSDEQIAFALRQAENGITVEEVCRKLGVLQPEARLPIQPEKGPVGLSC